MNLLKALEGISRSEKPLEEKNADGAASSSAVKTEETHTGAGGAQTEGSQTGGVQSEENFNAMQSVLERHEAIANRVKNRQRADR